MYDRFGGTNSEWVSGGCMTQQQQQLLKLFTLSMLFGAAIVAA